jgi:hypothetical protein
MLRNSTRPYTDRSVRSPAGVRIEERLAQRVLARPCTDGDELYGPDSDDQKCTEEGGSPGSLTERDLLLIRDQARIQHAETPEQIQGLTDAWNAAKELVHTNPQALDDPVQVEQMFWSLAKMIEPQKNAHGYRHVAVTFNDPKAKPAPPSHEVPDLMHGLFRAYSMSGYDPDVAYKKMMDVHPLTDGNGRIGDLFWKMDHVRRGNPWPDSHPPDLFDTDKSEFS